MRKLPVILLIFMFNCASSFGQNVPGKKALSIASSTQSTEPTTNELNNYTGVYQLTTDKNRTITVSKEDDHLVGAISGQTTLPLVFVSNTKFLFEGVTDATCEFVKEKGKVRRIVVFQNGKFVWNKVNMSSK